MMGIEIGSKTPSLEGAVIGMMGTGRGIMTRGEAAIDMMGIGIVVIETRVGIGIGTTVDDVVGRGAGIGIAMLRRPGIEIEIGTGTGTGTGTCAEADGMLVFPRGEATGTGIAIGTADEIEIGTGAIEPEVQPLGDGAAGREAASSAPANPILTVIWFGLPLGIHWRCRSTCNVWGCVVGVGSFGV